MTKVDFRSFLQSYRVWGELPVRRPRSTFALRKRNFYEVLGIGRSASEHEIKEAYFSLCKKYHPDAGARTSSTSRFIELNEAYSVLSNSASRLEYDRFLAGCDQPQFYPPEYTYAARRVYPEPSFHYYRSTGSNAATKDSTGLRTVAFFVCWTLFGFIVLQAVRFRILMQRRMVRQRMMKAKATMHGDTVDVRNMTPEEFSTWLEGERKTGGAIRPFPSP